MNDGENKNPYGEINFVLIGAKSTGKTVYLVSLYSGIPNIRAKDENTISYLKPLAKKLEKGKLPEATSAGLQELYFNYTDEKFNLVFQIDDYDGRFTQVYHEEKNSDYIRKLGDYIRNAKGIIFFIPYEEELDHDKFFDFKTEIDMFIEEASSKYKDRTKIPIPAVIAITKWDKSPYFKAENEYEKAIEYLEFNKIFKSIKEKIESHFEKVKVIPISSFEKYNLIVPIKFFLNNLIEVWTKKVEDLKGSEENKEKLLCFLKRILPYLKPDKFKNFYEEYELLEREIFTRLKREYDTLPDDKKNSFLEENRKVIKCLKKEHRNLFTSAISDKDEQEVLDQDGRSKGQKEGGRNISKAILILALPIIVIIIAAAFYLVSSQKDLGIEKTQGFVDREQGEEDFEKLKLEIENLTIDSNTDSIGSIKEQILKVKDSEKRSFLRDLLKEKADEMVEFALKSGDIDRIERAIEIGEVVEISKQKLDELYSEKKRLELERNFNTLIENMKGQEFNECLNMVRQEWKDAFGSAKADKVKEILDGKLNEKVEDLLDEYVKIPVTSYSDYENLKNTIEEIEELKEITLKSIDYKPQLSLNLEQKLKEYKSIFEHYRDALNNGVTPIYVIFKADKRENEPLGFDCDSIHSHDANIILKIGDREYSYELDQIKCVNEYGEKPTMIFKNEYSYKPEKYNVEIVEEDILSPDDRYRTELELSKNDILALENCELANISEEFKEYCEDIEKRIGNGYSVIFTYHEL